jgi:hypothetical protein
LPKHPLKSVIPSSSIPNHPVHSTILCRDKTDKAFVVLETLNPSTVKAVLRQLFAGYATHYDKSEGESYYVIINLVGHDTIRYITKE